MASPPSGGQKLSAVRQTDVGGYPSRSDSAFSPHPSRLTPCHLQHKALTAPKSLRSKGQLIPREKALKVIQNILTNGLKIAVDICVRITQHPQAKALHISITLFIGSASFLLIVL